MCYTKKLSERLKIFIFTAPPIIVDELAEDDMYAQYYRQQQQDQRGRGEVHEQKRAFFSSSKRVKNPLFILRSN